MKKKHIFWIMLILILSFVLSDYLEFFPTIHKDMSMSLPFTFEFIDAVDGSSVSGVLVNGSYEEEDAIAKRYADDSNIVSVVAIGGGFGYKQTFLFKKPSPRQTIQNINGKQIDFTFEHPNYLAVKKTLSKSTSMKINTIKLTPIQEPHLPE